MIIGAHSIIYSQKPEADRAFLEFRRRYPGFRITEEMLRRIERR